MSSQSKFYTKKNIDPKESISSITAVNISDKHLITGDEQGNLIVYEFGEKGLIVCKKSTPGSKTRIDKIVTHHSRKIAFVLVGGEVYYVKLPLMQVVQSLFKTKDTINIFLNRDDIGSENMILVLNKKKKLKLYELNITSDKVICIEKKLFKEITLEDFPGPREIILYIL